MAIFRQLSRKSDSLEVFLGGWAFYADRFSGLLHVLQLLPYTANFDESQSGHSGDHSGEHRHQDRIHLANLRTKQIYPANILGISKRVSCSDSGTDVLGRSSTG